eukprot:m.98194 g.98194  ORF g.98194 m.98194 type:complete len:870 (-) comp15265_c0_seq1:294-2903(-)
MASISSTVAAQLRDIGVPEGASVAVHTSLRGLRGNASERLEADDIIDGLLACVGSSGIVMVPTHTYSFVGLAEQPFSLDAPCNAEVGVLPEVARKRPDAVRSAHPTHSVGALGSGAAELVAGHDTATALGHGSPWHKMLENDGFVLLLACGHEANTFVHTCEALAKLPYLSASCWDAFWEPRAWTAVGGEEQTVELQEIPGCSRGFALSQLHTVLRARGAVMEGAVLGGRAVLVRMRDIMAAVTFMTATDPCALLCPPGNCDDEGKGLPAPKHPCNVRRTLARQASTSAESQRMFALGTAALGMTYGRTNQLGCPSRGAAVDIIKQAIQSGVVEIDTARAYGDAEGRVGEATTRIGPQAHVITKLDIPADWPSAPPRVLCAYVAASVFKSCRELGVHCLDTVLLHRFDQFQSPVWHHLLALRDQGVVGRVGISVYHPDDAVTVLKDPAVKHLQIPFNLIDWRWKQSTAFLEAAAARPDVTLHARSTFLQGILVNGASKWPTIEGVEAEKACATIQSVCSDLHRTSLLDLCVSYVRGHPWITAPVLGLESAAQLRELIGVFADCAPLTESEIAQVDAAMPHLPEQLLDPSQWLRDGPKPDAQLVATPNNVLQQFDMTGKVALVTGASGYLGAAFAACLAEAGASVVVTSRDLERAEQAAAQLPVVGPARHYGVQLDHMDEASIQQGFDKAVGVAGRVDVLINNGLAIGGPGKDLTSISFAEFTAMQDNNSGYFCLARQFRDHVVERGAPGSVVLIGSMYGQVASYPDAYAGVSAASSVAYHALKGGTIHMTRHLAAYWAADRVRVNCLSPGPFPSPAAPKQMVKRLCTKLPLQRMGLPHELKGSLLLLASDAGSYITGENLTVDGGWTAW